MDKVCAVFGGSRGIGRAVAQLMARKGYRLAIIARNLEGAKAAAGDLGGDHLAFSCDVAKEHDVQNTFEEMEKHLGRVNFLVNAAGINRDSLLVRTKTEDMISQLHTNLLGSMLTCKAAMRTMIQQQGGSIVNVGHRRGMLLHKRSIVGLKGNSGQSVYSASKGGLVGFSRALAKEVARKKIRVNVVAPGFVHTDMTKDLKEEHLKKNIPLGRFGETIEVAHAVVFLLESPYITGHVLVVDGGLQLLL
ncbi:carbonyl reductase family member 4 isoform X1 [Nomascus leucogenys]|uniref:carbonyl reductase family member 4 isoform X1 n=1 Tax=Nomascus leucogenys TaxID=61853 RepID=UPI00122D6D84|nr:carbonyl reductase family member 4 isoform X1 [Nomascus leucogenys]